MLLLDKNQYHKALKTLRDVSVNHLFARSVVEHHVNGSIYVDNLTNPSAFHVVHPYGMSLLFGITENDDFKQALAGYMLNTNSVRQKVEWMQAFPEQWNDRISEMLGNQLTKPDEPPEQKMIEVHTRANFRFDRVKYHFFRNDLQTGTYQIVRTDKALYEQMNGSVVPKYFWNNADDFCNKGVGFSLIIDGEPACTAYSAYIFDGQLELGIETLPHFRKMGYASYTCAALIEYCIENRYEPVWSCRLGNTSSFMLAQKLGFEPTVTLPYYRLPV